MKSQLLINAQHIEMTHYSIEHREQIVVKGNGFLYFAINISKKI